ncbi:MAG TPA: methyltransferase domain-containing protein, partial [Holophaga sp.]|nr:methyltransferase domain-containing protein [Holophaga sp.]
MAEGSRPTTRFVHRTPSRPSPSSSSTRLRTRRPGAEARWVDDALPELASLAGEAFDFILLGGVWMHVAPEDRPRALDALAALLAPGGRLALSLRHGPDPGGRGFHPVSGDEVAALAEARGLRVLRRVEEEDGLG